MKLQFLILAIFMVGVFSETVELCFEEYDACIACDTEKLFCCDTDNECANCAAATLTEDGFDPEDCVEIEEMMYELETVNVCMPDDENDCAEFTV